MFAKVNHVVNLRGKREENYKIIIEEKGFHSLIFVLDESSWPSSMHVGFTNDEFTKMYHTFMSLDGILFFGPQKRLSCNII